VHDIGAFWSTAGFPINIKYPKYWMEIKQTKLHGFTKYLFEILQSILQKIGTKFLRLEWFWDKWIKWDWDEGATFLKGIFLEGVWFDGTFQGFLNE
jgi:hypothetical protein